MKNNKTKKGVIPRIGNLNRTYRNFKRYQEIIVILIKHGFGEMLSQINLEQFKLFGKKIVSQANSETLALSKWKRIRLAFEELGPTFIKLGQILSNRPDLIPEKLIIELEKLQSEVPPFPGNIAKQIVEEQLPQPFDEVFAWFDEKSIASASIAQVHKAKLKTGEIVAVKIQRPNIKKTIEVDIEIMLHLAELLEKHIAEFQSISPIRIVEEFAETIKKEIDFNYETSYIERFKKMFENNRSIYVPKIFKQFSSKKILILEFIIGVKINNIEQLKAMGITPKEIAGKGTSLILKQIFDFGFFHADPHPGNILIMPDHRICFLDFGMMGSISQRYRNYLSDFMIAFVSNDVRKLVKILIQFSQTSTQINLNELENQLSELIERFTYLPLKDIDMSEVLDKSFKLVLSYELRLPPIMYLLSKSIVTIEGVARQLDPDFNMIAYIKPYAKKLIKRRLSPLRVSKDIYLSGVELAQLMQEFPFEARDLISQLKRGNLKVCFEHRGLESFMHKLDQITNRIAFAIVIAALIIGSSIIVYAAIPPLIKDVSLIGIIGYIAAGILGFWLIISIINSRKM